MPYRRNCHRQDPSPAPHGTPEHPRWRPSSVVPRRVHSLKDLPSANRDAFSSCPGLTSSYRPLSIPRPASEKHIVTRTANILFRDFGLTILLCVFKDFLLFARSAYSSGRFKKLETRPQRVLFGVPVKASQGSEGNSTCEPAGRSETRGWVVCTGPL